MLCPTMPLRKTQTEQTSVLSSAISVRIQILMQIQLVVRNRLRLEITNLQFLEKCNFFIFVDPDPQH
jgi:hypothetical protein